MGEESVQIVGSGVIGLTTGICLNLCGITTTIVTEQMPNLTEYITKSDTEIATEYAAASVKPSTIDVTEEVPKLLRDSIDIFDVFVDKTDCVAYIRHYIGGDTYKDPFYRDIVQGYQEDVSVAPGNVKYTDVFKCQFIDMPEYIKLLVDLYRRTGGSITIEKKTDLECEKMTINCTGCGSKELLNDTNMSKIQGHLAYVETGERVKRNDQIESYAYTIDDKPVYAYMQKERLVLGGTTIEETNPYSQYNTKPEKIPKHILDANKSILQNEYGINIFDYPIYGVSGYRPYRDGGVRIEKEQNCIHNYGHGGCGVTLSWGSALKVCNLLNCLNKTQIRNKLDLLLDD